MKPGSQFKISLILNRNKFTVKQENDVNIDWISTGLSYPTFELLEPDVKRFDSCEGRFMSIQCCLLT